MAGAGIDSFSMNVASVLRVKPVIRGVSAQYARELLQHALDMENPSMVRRLLTEALQPQGMGVLVH